MSVPQLHEKTPPTQPEVRLDIDQQTALLAIAVGNVMKSLSDMDAAKLWQRYHREQELRPNIRSITGCLEVIGLAYVKAVLKARDERLAELKQLAEAC